jgi:hypothetical protein
MRSSTRTLRPTVELGDTAEFGEAHRLSVFDQPEQCRHPSCGGSLELRHVTGVGGNQRSIRGILNHVPGVERVDHDIVGDQRRP